MRIINLLLMMSCLTATGGLGAEPPPAADPRVIPVQTALPEEGKVYPIAIVGAGAAGTMAADRAVLNNNTVLLFTGARQEQRRARGTWVRQVDNIPGMQRYQRAVLELRNETLQQLLEGPLAHNLYIIEDSVVAIERRDGHFALTDGDGRTFCAQYVVLATGMMDEQPHIQGSIRPILKYANGQTAAYCALCDGHRSYGKQAVVLGHSEAAGQVAALLTDKYQLSDTLLLTNGKAPALSEELRAALRAKNITIVEQPIVEVLGVAEQRLLTGFKLQDGSVVPAQIAFVALGVRPNNGLALQLGAQVDGSGLVVADANGETTVPDLFVIGDLRSGTLKQIYTAWQQAVEAMQLINRRLRQGA